jgi:hypothetical protein
MSSATSLWKLFRDDSERGSGISLKVFGFIAESVFAIIPECCSGSSWNGVRNHPGIAFTLDRIPQRLADRRAISGLARLYGAGDPFLLVVHDPFATLDEFFGLINEYRALAVQILSPHVCLGTHQISSFISLSSDAIPSSGAGVGCKKDSAC